MTDLRLIRVRMVKEFVYCPGQACMMWVLGRSIAVPTQPAKPPADDRFPDRPGQRGRGSRGHHRHRPGRKCQDQGGEHRQAVSGHREDGRGGVTGAAACTRAVWCRVKGRDRSQWRKVFEN